MQNVSNHIKRMLQDGAIEVVKVEERRGTNVYWYRACGISHYTFLEMHKRAGGRVLSVELLTEALVQTPEYGHVKQAEVKYHRARLQDAELLPRGRREVKV